MTGGAPVADCPHLRRCQDRVAALAALSDGWHDGAGKAPAPEAVAWIGQFILHLAAADLETLAVYPTDLGGFSMERAVAGDTWMMEIAPDGMMEII